MGMVTPLGHSVAETFAAALEGRSGIDRITHFVAKFQIGDVIGAQRIAMQQQGWGSCNCLGA